MLNRVLCLRHRTLTLFAACRGCLRERVVRSLGVRRAEILALKEKAVQLRAQRAGAKRNGGDAA